MRGRDTSFGLSANALKTIAIVAMLIDHLAHALVAPGSFAYVAMRFVGRQTAPIMFYFIAEGYRHTRDKNKYSLRLAVFATISYLPFVWFMTGGLPDSQSFLRLNVMYTLLIAYLALRAYKEIENKLLRLLAVFALAALSLPGDWSYLAVLYVLAFAHFEGDFKRQVIAFFVVTVVTGAEDYVYLLYRLIAGLPLPDSALAVALINLGRFLPIGLLYFYNGSKGRGGAWAKWAFYAFYPLHLILLSALALR